MESIDLNPRYSSNEEPGRCVKCLAEEKLFNCLRQLLKEENDSETIQQKYQVLYSFLQSPELQSLCDKTEKLLSEGKEVSVNITIENGKPKYEIKISDNIGGHITDENCSCNR
jgi:hypothetical protein